MIDNREACIISIVLGGINRGPKIQKRYMEITNERFFSGSLYTTLNRMESKGLLYSQYVSYEERKVFFITLLGRNDFSKYKKQMFKILKEVGIKCQELKE